MYDPAKLVGFDIEGHMMQPGLLAPPLVCAAVCISGKSGLLDRAQALDMFETLLLSDLIIVGTYIHFDCVVMANERPHLLPLIFKAYKQKRIYDISVSEQLNAIADGQLGTDPRTGRPIKPEPGKKRGWYSLRFCVDLRLGRDDAKANDLWRTRYAILERLPISEWPESAREYPKDDVRNPIEVAHRQIELTDAGDFRNQHNIPEQVYTSYCLQLGSAWGFRTSRPRYDKLALMVEATRGKALDHFRSVGFIKDNGKEDEPAVKRAVVRAYATEHVSECQRCGGSGKVKSERSGNLINCKYDVDLGGCDGTGLYLDSVQTLPRTDTGGVSTSRDTLTESGDETLIEYGENESEKLHTTYLPFIAKGLDQPINPSANVLKETGRISYDGVIQQLPRQVLCPYCVGRGNDCPQSGCKKGIVSGIRECIVARPGYYFCSVDFGALELCTLAQVCLWVCGYSRMAEVINETGDPGSLHTAFAANLLGKPFAEVQALLKAKDAQALQARQGAKAGNFGFPGGMGAAKLVLTKRKKNEGITRSPDGEIVYAGIRFCILLGGENRCGLEKVTEWNGRQCAPICKRCVEIVQHDLKPAWFAQWPEVKEYHRWVSDQVDDGGEFPCFAPTRVERIRGGLDFSNGANNGFQALGADGAKRGFCAVTEECYAVPESPLYGSHPLFLWHDEIITEMPIATSHEASYRKSEIMLREMAYYVPDVTCRADPALSVYLCKGAEPKFNEQGILIPWDTDDRVLIAC